MQRHFSIELSSRKSKSLDGLTMIVLNMDNAVFERAFAAVARYTRRQAGREFPEGGLNERGQWAPGPAEVAALSPAAKAPNAQSPDALRLACKSLAHCVKLEGAEYYASVWVKHWALWVVDTDARPLHELPAHRSALKLTLAIDTAQVAVNPRRPRL